MRSISYYFKRELNKKPLGFFKNSVGFKLKFEPNFLIVLYFFFIVCQFIKLTNQRST